MKQPRQRKPGDVPVYWLTITDRVEVSLRRYCSGGPGTRCQCGGGFSYHNGSAVIYPDVPKSEWLVDRPDGIIDLLPGRQTEHLLGHSGWPVKCDGCDYVFRLDDKWQVNAWPLYAGAPDGRLYTTRSAPVGAMWDATWDPAKGQDGISLIIKIPSGVDFAIDAIKDSKGRGWTRTGDPRQPATFTITPSINHEGQWHGHLTRGVLHL